MSFINTPGRFEGSSLVAFDALLRAGGYALVYATKWNAFFVRGDIADHFVATAPAEAFDYRSTRFVVSFFDGRNRIVNAAGKSVRARNPWSKTTAAVALKIPSGQRIGIGLTAIVIVALATAWLLLDQGAGGIRRTDEAAKDAQQGSEPLAWQSDVTQQ